jgi:hypothetical protein
MSLFKLDKAPVMLTEKWKPHEKEVRYLVRESDHYIVFIDRELDVDWDTDSELNKSLDKQKGTEAEKQYYNALTQAAVVETMPSDGLNLTKKLRFKRLVGEAIVCCLEQQYENALRALGFARDYLHDRTIETSRFWYLSSSIVCALPFVGIAFVSWIERAALITILGDKAFWLIVTACYGATGALLSVMIRTGNLSFDTASGFWLHWLEALSRISVGALSGGFIGLAIQSKLFLSLLSGNSQTHLLMMIGAFVAGAGERLAPSIIAQFESKLPSRTISYQAEEDQGNAQVR